MKYIIRQMIPSDWGQVKEIYEEGIKTKNASPYLLLSVINGVYHDMSFFSVSLNYKIRDSLKKINNNFL